jgi:hypothetical protein
MPVQADDGAGDQPLPQRIDDKIGRLVREGGRQRPCRPERK